MSGLTLVPPTIVQQVAEIVALLRSAGFKAIPAASGTEGEYAAVIIPPPNGGKYYVTPTPAGWRVRWRPTDGTLVTVDVADTAARAADLICDHLDGTYP